MAEPIPPDLEELCLEAPELLLRAPRESDLDAMARIDAEWSGVDRREYLRARLGRALRPDGVTLARVAALGDRVLGFLVGEVTRGEYGRVEPVAWIDTVGVGRDAARKGVGRALLDDFLRHARAAGATRVRTLLDPEQEALAEFLDAQGFRMAPTRVVERALR
ncbi:MAG: GNAT family N-acetyltransferase [Myxococcota bacterium]